MPVFHHSTATDHCRSAVAVLPFHRTTAVVLFRSYVAVTLIGCPPMAERQK